MANDKNFKIKNGLSAKRYLLNGSTLSGSTIDLSLASVFSTTLSSDPAYTFTNPPPSGTAQAFSVEVTGGTTTFTQDSFATTLYTGNESTQTITNGLDLATDGGLVWVKDRVNNITHGLFDTERGIYKVLDSASNAVEETQTTSLTAFNSDGFTLGNRSDYNGASRSYVSWGFKKSDSFFDVVTYTGDGTSDRVINHSLNCDAGFIVIKKRNSTSSGDWYTWHRSDVNGYMRLNETAASTSYVDYLNPTSTTFTLKADGTNTNGDTYVAYLFAHDTASDSRIKCGSYTTDANEDATVTLGWKPSWLLVKRSDSATAGDWRIIDSVRGVTDAGDAAYLEANTTDAEAQTGSGRYTFTDTGFTQDNFGASRPYIYIAIRASTATDSAITWPSSVKWPSGLAPTTPAPGTKDLFTFLTTDGGTTYYGKKAGSDIA